LRIVGDDMNLYLLHLDGESATEPLLATDFNEIHPALSPDDRWLAYASDVTGKYEVYVQPFPDLGATIRVSPKGGHEPVWSPSGDRLYYRSLDGRQAFAVEVRSDGPVSVGKEELLFEGDFAPGIRWGSKWDIHPEGDRFLMLQLDHPKPVEGIRVVVNGLAEASRSTPQDD
jgi:hypothetical protein